MRGLATGTTFDLTGPPSPSWLVSERNELGLPAFEHWLAESAVASEPAARDAALARALMALGGMLTLLQDAGEPAHVRNDFREAFLGQHTGQVRTSRYEEFVADSLGRGGVPAAAEPVRRPDLRSFFTASDGLGLADRTNRGFFSEGTLPTDGVVGRQTSAHDVLVAARGSLTYALPGLPRLELREPGRVRYAQVAGRRALAYVRVPGRVRFFLDRAVFADSARALLPQIGAYGAGMVDHLFRAEIGLAVSEGAVEVRTLSEGLGAGTVRVVAEDAAGVRREIGSIDVKEAGASGTPLGKVALPAGVRRVAAAYLGRDAAGSAVAVAELRVP